MEKMTLDVHTEMPAAAFWQSLLAACLGGSDDHDTAGDAVSKMSLTLVHDPDEGCDWCKGCGTVGFQSVCRFIDGEHRTVSIDREQAAPSWCPFRAEPDPLSGEVRAMAEWVLATTKWLHRMAFERAKHRSTVAAEATARRVLGRE